MQCAELRQMVESLEQQLVELDAQHQEALDVAVSNRQRLHEENEHLLQQLQQQVTINCMKTSDNRVLNH